MQNGEPDDEIHLIGLAQSGDRAAYDRLVAPCLSRLRRFCRGFVNEAECDDVVQETLIRGWTQITRFRGDCAFLTWLLRVATSKGVDCLRSQRVWLSLDAVEQEMAPVTDVAEQALVNLEAAGLESLLAELPGRQTEVLRLTAEGYSDAQIAEKLKVKPATVRSDRLRGRRALVELVLKRNSATKPPPGNV